jgi:hypothetical protein
MLNVSTGGRHVFPRISCHFSNIASTHSGRVQIRRLEVERKFLVTPVAVSYLRSNSGGSRFKKHESLGKQTTQDTYYDRNGLLFSKGVYIRRRNGHWEAKIRTDGDFINSAFTEVDQIAGDEDETIRRRNMLETELGSLKAGEKILES